MRKAIIYFISILFVFFLFSCTRTSCTDFPVNIDKVTFSEANESMTIYGSVTNKSGHFVNELKLHVYLSAVTKDGGDRIISFYDEDIKLSKVINDNEAEKFQKTLYIKKGSVDFYRYDFKKAKLRIGSKAKNNVGYDSWKGKSFDDYYEPCKINITKEWKEYVLSVRKKYNLN